MVMYFCCTEKVDFHFDTSDTEILAVLMTGEKVLLIQFSLNLH